MKRRDLSKTALMGLPLLSGVIASRPMSMAAQATPPAETEEKVLFGAYPEGKTDGERFEFDLEPGQSTTQVLIMLNAGTVPIQLESYTANVRTAPNGGLTMDQPDVELGTPGNWMDFPIGMMDVQPGQEVRREFTVTAPESATAGQYVNAIAVQTVDSYEIEGNSTFRQRVRKVLAVYITVPGELMAVFEFGQPLVEFRVRGPVLQVPLINTGNVRIRPRGEVLVKDPLGVEMLNSTVEMGSVFAGHSTVAEVRMPTSLPSGEYLLSITLSDEEWGAEASMEDALFTMPEAPEEELLNPIELQSAAISPNADPPQFLTVKIDLANSGDIVQSSNWTLSVMRDGELVEDFPLAASVVINPGITSVEQRYIPIAGFESGTYTFALKVESIDINSGAATVVFLSELTENAIQIG